MNKLRVKLLMLKLSLRWVRAINIGDLVWYQGIQYRVMQMVCYPGIEISQDEGFSRRHVQVGECEKVRSISNYLSSFKSAWRFYRTSWQDIWEREGIQPWMRGCNIWKDRA